MGDPPGQLADGFHLAGLVAGELAALLVFAGRRGLGVKALLQVLQLVARQVLPAPVAQGGLGRVQQLGVFERCDQQDQVAHRVVGRALGRLAPLTEQHDGQVRPARLLVDECLQQRAWALIEHLLGNDRQACAFGQAGLQVGQVDRAQAVDARASEQASSIRG
ncbi:hypothetical protein D3C79_643220 [compost metagenome]